MFDYEFTELDTADFHPHIEGDEIEIDSDLSTNLQENNYDLADRLPADVLAYFKDRAQEYGIDVDNLVEEIPKSLRDDPYKMQAYLMHKHISHHIPLSQDGEAADPTNWDLEDEGKNLSRGAKVKTESEIAANKLDAQLDAERLNEYIRTNRVPTEVLLSGDEMGKAYISYTKLVTTEASTEKTVTSAALKLLSLCS